MAISHVSTVSELLIPSRTVMVLLPICCNQHAAGSQGAEWGALPMFDGLAQG